VEIVYPDGLHFRAMDDQARHGRTGMKVRSFRHIAATPVAIADRISPASFADFLLPHIPFIS
jgi:hypothetical protein